MQQQPISIFPVVPVGLDQMLCRREARVQSQMRILNRFGLPIVSFSLNIPGPIKDTPAARLLFWAGLQAMQQALGPGVYQKTYFGPTGPEAIVVCRMSPRALKAAAEKIEASHIAGRLFDMDVIDTDGKKLSRQEPRRCIVCGGEVLPCARTRAHGLAELTRKTRHLLDSYAAPCFAAAARQALIDEVDFTPKPGLVDANNTGAHQDMTRELFHKSAQALAPYFERFYLTGSTQPDDMGVLWQLGLEAGEAMLDATGGVNTHKGSIFSFGLLLGALGASMHDGKPLFPRVQHLASRLPPQSPESHGARMYARFGAGGARAEAESGFLLAQQACRVMDEADAMRALLHLMASCEDTNVLYRGGRDGLSFMKAQSCAILQAPQAQQEALMLELDRQMIARNLSPGGCADLFAMALFLHRLGLCAQKDSEETI